MKKLSFIVAIFLFSTCNLLTFAQNNKASKHSFSLEGGMLYVDMETMQLLGEWGQQDKMTLRQYLSTKLSPTEVEEFLKLYQTASQAEAQQQLCNCAPVSVNTSPWSTPEATWSTSGNPSTERYVKGAAHKLYARIGGGSTATASYTLFHSGTDPNTTNSVCELWYNYVCMNASGYPTNCGCTKNLTIKMGYDARLRTVTYNSGGTGNRNAAVAEDAMALIEFDVPLGTVTPLAVRQARLINYRNTGMPTTAPSINIGKIVANNLQSYNINALTVEYDVNNASDSRAYPTYSQAYSQSYYGTGNYPYTMSRVYYGTVSLRPNALKLISLMSNGHVYGSGKTGLLSNTYYCKSHTVSNYYLAGYIPYQNELSCCINKSAAFKLNSVPASVNVEASLRDDPTLRNEVASFLSPYAPWTNGWPLSGDWNTLSATPQCPGISDHKTETTSNNYLSLAPNPTNETLRISWNYTLPENVPLKIFDLQGREVLQETIAKDSYGTTLNLTELQAGMYLVVAYMPNGSINTQKFTKL
jgi:hypothetical protein